jgi:hypothetical protein
MRGTDVDQGGLSSYVPMEERVPDTHALRRVRALLDEALESVSRVPMCVPVRVRRRCV